MANFCRSLALPLPILAALALAVSQPGSSSRCSTRVSQPSIASNSTGGPNGIVVVLQMKMRKFLLGLATLASLTAPASAWWAGGHRSVGIIALHRLSPRTREKLMAILSHHPDGGEYATSFSRACVWPDEIRKKPGDHPTWHYRDRAFFDNIEEHPIAQDEQNALWALAKNRAILLDPGASDSDKAVAICWIGHVVGDVHQPLHATTRCDVVHPDGDRGGNLFPLQIDGVAHANLHKFWDSVGLELNPDPSPEGLEAFVRKVEMRFPATAVASLTGDHDPAHWLQESYDIAINFAYPGIHNNEHPTPNYIETSQALCEKRIALAGYRLADVFEETLGEQR